MPFWLAFAGAVGATLVLTLGSVFEALRASWPRKLGGQAFIGCPLCVGTWVGAASYLLTPSWKLAFVQALSALWFGAAVGATALLLRRAIDALGSVE